MAPAGPRYIVGIDLGTTHTVVASADTARATDEEEAPAIESFRVPQLVAPGEIASRDMLPSARYQPAEGELGPGETVLPWGTEGEIVGRLALELGAKVPSRLVASAKSWLSHAGVDRTADILPWGAKGEVQKISHVEASASYLRHVAAAWNHEHPEHPLAQQEIVLTVPASFDEGARALTLEAAKRAGLDRVRLVEEPQAAMYQWLDRHRDSLDELLSGVRLAIVVDVGGGTTDLTLIKVELRESGPRLTRIAVGDHLMLGGDNMDLALARAAEPRVAKDASLGAGRFSQLIQQARSAKEQLLSAGAKGHAKITILGSGSKLIGGARSTDMTKEEVEELVLDGFFPRIAPSERPAKRRGALIEFGLPYVADPGITRHIAAFLDHHRELARGALGDVRSDGLAVPDAVLLNGGVFRGESLSTRLLEVLGALGGGEPPRRLENDSPELAVARGAVAYGLARRGIGLRIGGGSARSYFLVLPAEEGETQKGICVLPRGSEEGEEIELERRNMSLRIGRPVRFPLVATSQDVRHHRPGDIVDVEGETFHDLPLMAAVLDSDDPAQKDTEIPVKVITSLTEVGTLEMSCVASSDPRRRWKLEMALRGASAREVAAQKVTQLHPRFKEATDLVRRIYGTSTEGVKPSEVKTLRANLEKIIGSRDTWDTPLLRELYGALFANVKRRRRSAAHERVWMNLAGYSLRPGFGYPLDEWRVKELWSIFDAGIQYVSESQNWAEWWILWRRVAGGLTKDMQDELLDDIEWYLHPPTKRPRKRPPGPKMAGYDDMVRLAGSLEHVSSERKVQVGDWLSTRLLAHDENTQTWWALGRIGARVPFYGSAHAVVPREAAERWLSACLGADFAKEEQAAFAAAVISRMSGDRQRDLPLSARTQVAKRLEVAGAPDAWRRMVTEVTHLDAVEERRIFGESLPEGLRLMD
jgi:molecular chaperone DnaK (HSP70)